MVSVTGRIKDVKQPWGGYIKPKEFAVTDLQDEKALHENETIHSILIGIAVDYLTRIQNGTPSREVFKISLAGASRIQKYELAKNLLSNIKGIDDTSIINACKLSGFDVVSRSGTRGYKPVESINPDAKTIENIRVMVKRSLHFIELYGPIVKDGFTFEGGYTNIVSSGDGDFLTEDTLWDFKVSKSNPTNKHTLQLLMYYLMGVRSVHPEFAHIKKLGIFNPRLNKVFLLPIVALSDDVMNEVSTIVIGYANSEDKQTTDKEYSDHFIKFVIKGEEFDFNVFKTQEEFDTYEQELKEFSGMDEEEVRRVILKYKS